MKTIIEIIVCSDDIDDLDHVNNSVYVSYLERGRSDWYSKAGISFESMRTRGIGTVVLRLDILYLKEAVLGDVLKVSTIPIKIGNKSFVFKQEIYNQHEELITEATITNVMLDRQTRKSTAVASEIAQFFI